jgi:chemotaxis protein CheX
MIGIAGDQAKGSLAISFTESAILDIASKMFGEPITEVNDEIADMVGEITNMVTGGAKVALSEKGYKFKMAIPTTIMGRNHSIKHSSKGPIIMIPFETEAGTFFVEICFETNGVEN